MTLWHYCPTSAFGQIITTKSFRMSDLAHSNDLKEGHVFSDGVRYLFELEKDSDVHLRMIRAVAAYVNDSKGLGFCMTKLFDNLSQWVTYADGGTGVSIGFCEDSFDLFSMIDLQRKQYLEKVVIGYRGEDLEICIKTFVERSQDIDLDDTGFTQSLDSFVASNMYRWKRPGFEEEEETRFVTRYSVGINDNDLDGVELFSKRDVLVPYIDYSFSYLEFPLTESVVLGPKNRTNKVVLKHWLEKKGFGDVEVKTSEIPYT